MAISPTVRGVSLCPRTASIVAFAFVLSFTNVFAAGPDKPPSAAAAPAPAQPPPPLTRVPSTLSVLLERSYPWRAWNRIETQPGGSVRATYTLIAPEYAPFTAARTATGLDLGILRGLPLEFVEPVRPAGATGVFAAKRFVRVTNTASLGTWFSYEFEGETDTPADGAKVGAGLESSAFPLRVDVTSPEFPALHARLAKQLAVLAPLMAERNRLSIWTGVVAYPKKNLSLRLRLNAYTFVEVVGANQRVRVRSINGRRAIPTLVRDDDRWNAALILETSGMAGRDFVLDESTRFVFEELMNADPQAAILSIAERADQADGSALPAKAPRPVTSRFDPIFQHLLIRVLDSNTLRISALGMPETVFKRAK